MSGNILLRLSSRQMDALDFFVSTEKRTRTDVIRDAIESYINRKKENEKAVNVFGLWKKRNNIDGMEYQERMRSEW